MKKLLFSFILRLSITFILMTAVITGGIMYYYSEETVEDIKAVVASEREHLRQSFTNMGSSEFQDYIKTLVVNNDIRHFAIYSDDGSITMNEHRKDLPAEISDRMLEMPVPKQGYIDYDIIPMPEIKKAYLVYAENPADIAGSYKFVMRIPQETIDAMRQDAKAAVPIALLIILLTGAVIFPLVYKEYKAVLKSRNEILISNINTLRALGNAVAKRDSDTSEHNFRVVFYSIQLAELYGLSDKNFLGLLKGAFLHDVGKIAISDNILLKPGKLTAEEFEQMKTHVKEGAEIVAGIKWLEDAEKVILCHHEKYDGKGYPKGLKGEIIPVEARIFAIADVFDALTSRRPYKEAFTVKKSLEIMEGNSGTHFDPKLLKIFMKHAQGWHDEVKDKDKKALETILADTITPYFKS